MALFISTRTREHTAECMFSFQCLEEATRNVCDIDAHIEESLCSLDFVKNHLCSYKRRLGPSYYVCTCPTRFELYKRYRI